MKFGNMTTIGEMTFADLTLGEMAFDDLTFGEVLGNHHHNIAIAEMRILPQ